MKDLYPDLFERSADGEALVFTVLDYQQGGWELEFAVPQRFPDWELEFVYLFFLSYLFLGA